MPKIVTGVDELFGVIQAGLFGAIAGVATHISVSPYQALAARAQFSKIMRIGLTKPDLSSFGGIESTLGVPKLPHSNDVPSMLLAACHYRVTATKTQALAIR